MNNRHSILARCMSVFLSMLIVLTMMPTVAIAEENADAQQVKQEQTEKSEPAPEKAAEPAPASAPEPAPAPEPEKEAEPAPEPEPTPAPEKAAEPAPAPAAAPADTGSQDSKDQAAAEKAQPAAEKAVAAEEPAKPEVKAEEKKEEKKEDKKEEEKEEYPAQTLTANAGGVKVTLKAPEGALPKGAKLNAKQVGQKYINAVEDTLEAQGRELTDAVAIDVTPVNKDGKEIQPKKSVSVTFSGAGLDLEAGDTVNVYRVSDDASSVTNMGGSGNANSATFSTNHFTIYVQGGSTTNPNGDGSGQNTSNNPLEIANGASVTLNSNEWSTTWNIITSGGGTYISLTNKQTRSVIVNNNNQTSSDQLIQIGHHSNNSETYWVLAKGVAPTTATVKYAPGEKGTWAEADETYEDVIIGSATPTFGTKSGAKMTDCAAGYSFKEWSPDLEQNVTKDQTYTAQWEQNTDTPYTVEFYYMDKTSGQYPSTATSTDFRTGTTDTEAEVTANDKTPDPSKNGYELDEDKADAWSGNIDGDGSRVLKVYFKLSKYTVDFDPGEQGTWAATDETYSDLLYGADTPTFGTNSGAATTDCAAGYSFKEWSPVFEQNVTKDQTYTAQWEAITYEITYDYAEGTKPATDNPTTYTVEDNITIDQEPTRTGYKFLGWTSDDMSTPITDPTTPVEWNAEDEIGDKTFTAKWAKLVTLTYDKNSSPDAATVPDPVTDLIEGDEVELGTATREGYAFKSWNTQADGEGTPFGAGVDFEMPDDDVTLYAQWEEKTITVTYYDGTTQYDQDTNVAANNDHYVVIPDILTKQDYLFAGWSTDPNATEGKFFPKGYCPTGEKDIDLYAVWIPFSLEYLEIQELHANEITTTYNGTEQKVSDVEEVDCDYPESGHSQPRKYPGYVKVANHEVGTSRNNIYAHIEPIEASGTEAGQYPTPIYARLYTHVQEGEGRFEPLTGDQQGIPVKGNGLIIEPLTVTIVSTDSATKEYDGEPLTADGTLRFAGGTASFEYGGTAVVLVNDETLFVETTGSRTDPGESDNTYQIDWSKSTAKKVNYTIDEENVSIGKLKVTAKTVKYDGNTDDATLDNVPERTDTAVSPYTISDKVPTRENYEFTYWTTDKAGKGDPFKPKGEYTFPEGTDEVTFYAQWQGKEKIIVYDANGGKVKGEPSITETHRYDDEITITEAATSEDGLVFKGWQEVDGKLYQPGDKYKVTGPTTFIAQWKMPITFDPNGGKLDGKTDPQVTEYDPGSDFPIAEKPEREGYTFKEWNTKKDGSGDGFQPGDQYESSSAMTFYAIWEKDEPDKIKITFDPNGGKLNGKTDPSESVYDYGSEITIEDAATRDGYKFIEWNTKKDGSGDSYDPGDKLVLEKDMTLYAIWEKNDPDKVEITYDPNGGVFRGSSDPVSILYDKGEVIEIAEEPTRDGYEFLYWKGSKYYPGEAYEANEDHTFVAQWKKVAETDPEKKDTKKTTKKSKKKSVETGDNTFMINWYMLMILAQIAFIAVMASKVRRNRSK